MATLIQALILFLFLTTATCVELSDKEILEFEAPEEIKKSCPYFLSGYAKDGAPIWVIPMGKYDLRRYIEKGGELEKAISIYMDQSFLIMAESARNSTAKQFLCIIDMAGFNSRQAGHIPTVQMIVSKFTRLKQSVSPGGLRHGWIVNSDFLWESLWPLARSVLGPLGKHMETCGKNSQVWKPKILSEVPKDQIPERYGGLKGHTHVKIMG